MRLTVPFRSFAGLCLLAVTLLLAFAAGAAGQTLAKQSPVNGATNQGRAVSLVWSPVAGADEYAVCVSTTPGGGNCDDSWTNWVDRGTAIYSSINSLDWGATYYWQVRAYVNNYGDIVYADNGTWWSFTVAPEPGTFGKSLPTDGTANLTSPVSISWGAATGASEYDYCVSTTSGQCPSDNWVSAGTNLSASVSNLADGIYYWQARASVNNAWVEADTGAWWSFAVGAPFAFGKSLPTSGTANLTSPVAISWGAVQGASEYDYCVSTTSGQCPSNNWLSAGTNTSTSVSNLANGTYYWQVRTTVNGYTVEADSGTWWAFTVGSVTFGKTAPSSGTTLSGGTVTLSWPSVAGATYQVCVGSTQAGTCSTSWVLTSATSITVAIQTPGTFYWQVEAVVGNTTTPADGGTWWSFTVPAPVSGFTKTAPTDGGIASPGWVKLRWSPASGATNYEVCVSATGPACDSVWVANAASTMTSRNLTNGIYFWQVRTSVNGAYADNGHWSEIIVGTPAATFAKQAPANNAEQSSAVTFNWASVANATYQVCVATTNTGGCDTSWISTGSATSFSVTGLPLGTYYWQVRATTTTMTRDADAGTWWSFTVNVPFAFGKSLPANGTANLTSPVAISWGAVQGASEYDYCVSTTSGQCPSNNWLSAGTNTAASVSNLADGTYYWQVRTTVNGDTAQADGGTWWSFTVGSVTFGKTAPSSGTTLSGGTVTLSWPSVAGATYQVCVDSVQAGTCSTSWVVTSATSITVAIETPGMFYWQVEATVGNTTTSADGGTWWSFTVPAPASGFTKTAPTDGGTASPGWVGLRWSAVAGATNYEVCVSATGPACDTGWAANAAVTSTSRNLTNGIYFWQVRTWVNGTIYADSGHWSEIVVGTPAATFAKQSPANGAEQTSAVTFNWASVANATYQVCMATTNTGKCDTSWISTGSATSFSVTGLPLGTYYWQVRATTTATRDADAGTWWSFTVSVPFTFGKLLPATGTANLTSPVSISWGTVAGASEYDYCVSTTSGQCSNSWVSAGTTTSASVSNLADGTYYWQVRATVNGDTGQADGSTWWAFTVGPVTFGKTAPGSGSAVNGAGVTLSWEAVVGATYQVCLDSTQAGSCSTSWVATAATSVTASIRQPGTYYWQVRTVANNTTTDADSGTWWTFTVQAPYFTKTIPPDGRTASPGWVVLSWSAFGGAFNYEVCLSPTGPACDTVWAANAISTVTSRKLADGIYFWQVRTVHWMVPGPNPVAGLYYADDSGAYALNPLASSDAPGAWNEVIVGTPAATFAKQSPANGAGQTSAVTFNWASVANATYQVCVSTTNTGRCDTSWISAGSATSFSVSGLSPGTYYWQVRETSTTTRDGDAGTWWSFTVGSE